MGDKWFLWDPASPLVVPMSSQPSQGKVLHGFSPNPKIPGPLWALGGLRIDPCHMSSIDPAVLHLVSLVHGPTARSSNSRPLAALRNLALAVPTQQQQQDHGVQLHILLKESIEGHLGLPQGPTGTTRAQQGPKGAPGPKISP